MRRAMSVGGWVLVLAVLLVPGGRAEEAAWCPAQCECSTSELVTVQCAHVIVKARDDGYAEVDCQGNGWNCSSIPRVAVGHGGVLQRLEVTSCGAAVSSEERGYRCGVTSTGAGDARALALVDARADLEEEDVRGMSALRALYVAAAPGGVQSIPVGAILSLPSLQSVRLLSLSSPRLARDMFLSSLSPLQRVEVGMSPLGEIPQRSFAGLNNLTVLSLWKDNLTRIHVDALEGIPSLRELILNNNPLRNIPAGIFRHTPHMQRICLEYTRLETLEEGVVSGLPELREIKFRNKVELKLAPLSLSHLPSLTSVQLSHSHISSLPPRLFVNSSNLVNLTLNNNNISTLSAEVFSTLTALVKLDLSENRIEEVERGMFENMRMLEELRLDGNRIQVLPDLLFSGLSHLSSISLSRNLISTISLSAFMGVQSLSSLSLQYNRLSWGREEEMCGGDVFLVEPSSPFNMLSNLKELNLGHNNISAVFSDWRLVLLTLASLDLSHNAFTELTASDLQFLHSHIEVDFSHNHITTVNPHYLYSLSLSSHPSSLTFRLGHNPYDCSCSLYHFLTEIEQTDTYDVSAATCATPAYMNNTPLAAVQLYDVTCPVHDVSRPCSCLMRPFEMRIECDCETLTDLPDPAESGFDTISLRLRSLAGDLASLPEHVRELNLSGLGLTELPPIPETVRSLDLSFNKLERIPAELLRGNTTVRLSHNPFACECRTAGDVALLRNSSRLVADYERVTCARARSVDAVDPEALCSVYRSAVAGCLAAAALLLLGLLAATLHRHRVRLQVYLYGRGACLRLLPAQPEGGEPYDVFVSFAHEDEKFVCEEVLPALEGRYVLLVQERDWRAGGTVPAHLRDSVRAAARTLVVLTDHFLGSLWSMELLRCLHARAAADRRPRAVVLHRTTRPLDSDFRTYLALATTVKWTDRMFWEKVFYALPRKDARGGRRGAGDARGAGGKNGCLNVMLNEQGKLVNKGYVKE